MQCPLVNQGAGIHQLRPHQCGALTGVSQTTLGAVAQAVLELAQLLGAVPPPLLRMRDPGPERRQLGLPVLHLPLHLSAQALLQVVQFLRMSLQQMPWRSVPAGEFMVALCGPT